MLSLHNTWKKISYITYLHKNKNVIKTENINMSSLFSDTEKKKMIFGYMTSVPNFIQHVTLKIGIAHL